MLLLADVSNNQCRSVIFLLISCRFFLIHSPMEKNSKRNFLSILKRVILHRVKPQTDADHCPCLDCYNARRKRPDKTVAAPLKQT